MKISSKLLPENIRKCMPKEDRQKTGALTLVEVFDKADRGEELKLHDKFCDWCRLNEIPFIRCRPDRKSTIAPGHPDFSLLYNKLGCCIEFKAEGGQLSPEQMDRIGELERAGVPCLVTFSLVAAIGFARRTLGLANVKGTWG